MRDFFPQNYKIYTCDFNCEDKVRISSVLSFEFFSELYDIISNLTITFINCTFENCVTLKVADFFFFKDQFQKVSD